MVENLVKDIWNNFIAIPYNKNKQHQLSVSKLKTIIENNLGKDQVKVRIKPFEINKVYQTKWATKEQFIIKEIKYKFDRDLKKNVPYYFLGFIENKEHLGLCPINIDRLIPNTY